MIDIKQYNLHELAQQGDFEILDTILSQAEEAEKKAAMDTLDEGEGLSPLHYSVRANRLDVTQLLLKHGADSNLCDKYKLPPLNSAITNQAEEAVVRCLLDYDADPTLNRNDNEYGLLHLVVLSICDFKIAYCLLNHPKITTNSKGNLNLRDYQALFIGHYGNTVLRLLLLQLLYCSDTPPQSNSLDDTKRHVYVFLLSGINVKRALSNLTFKHEERTRLKNLLEQAEGFISQIRREFGFLGEEIVHQCVLSSEEERKTFKEESDAFIDSMLERNNAIKSGVVKKQKKEFPVELSMLVSKNLAPKSIHFFQPNRAHDKTPSIEIPNISRLSL